MFKDDEDSKTEEAKKEPAERSIQDFQARTVNICLR